MLVNGARSRLRVLRGQSHRPPAWASLSNSGFVPYAWVVSLAASTAAKEGTLQHESREQGIGQVLYDKWCKTYRVMPPRGLFTVRAPRQKAQAA